MSEAAIRYEALAATFADDPEVTRPERKGFARGALMRGGKLFATLRGERLLLKLPASRVLQLIDMGLGEPFDANKGRPMKEWVTVSLDGDWPALAGEAYEFVGA